jgi:hypothetical protein
MRANLGMGIPAICKLSKFGSLPDSMPNMGRLYMYLRLYEADERRQRHAMRHNGADASGRRAYGAEVGIHGLLLNDVASLPILLIIHDERQQGGGCKDSSIAVGREQSLALPKTNVADTKLHSAGCAVPRWERVFTDT